MLENFWTKKRKPVKKLNLQNCLLTSIYFPLFWFLRIQKFFECATDFPMWRTQQIMESIQVLKKKLIKYKPNFPTNGHINYFADLPVSAPNFVECKNATNLSNTCILLVE